MTKLIKPTKLATLLMAGASLMLLASPALAQSTATQAMEASKR